MFELLKNLGALRVLLLLAAIAFMFVRSEPGTEAARTGWEMIPTLIAPVLAPLVFLGLLFDFMMCRIRMTDEYARKKFRNISYIELSAAIVLMLIWLPFFLAIGRQV